MQKTASANLCTQKSFFLPSRANQKRPDHHVSTMDAKIVIGAIFFAINGPKGHVDPILGYYRTLLREKKQIMILPKHIHGMQNGSVSGKTFSLSSTTMVQYLPTDADF